MKMRKLLAILLALSLVFSMSAMAFADDDVVEDPDAVEEEAVTEEEEDGEDGEEEASDFEIPVPGRVVLSVWKLMLDGEDVDVQPYNIDGANYFKLRDLAALMSGTGSQFNVVYEAPNMLVTTGEEYETIGGELVKGDDKSASCVPSSQVLLVDGERVDILVYNIGGNNYFQLRGLGELIGFSVDFTASTYTMIVETEGYEPAEGPDEEDEDEDEDGDEEGDEEDEE